MDCHSSSSLHHLLFISVLSNCPLFIRAVHLPWICAFILSLLPPVWCFARFNFLSLLSSHCCYHLLFPFSVSLPLSLTVPLHFHFYTSSPLLAFSLQRGHSMNNSEALQDDNGKLEVRLCIACARVCVRLVDSFWPGGNCKGLFIHINYVNNLTLLFKVSKWRRVTGNLVISEWWSNDYPSMLYQHYRQPPLEPSVKACWWENLQKNLKPFAVLWCQ